MEEKIKKLREFLCKEFFVGDKFIYPSKIEILTDHDSLIFSANQGGYIHLIWLISELCEYNTNGSHFHIDEYTNTQKCEIPMVFGIIKEE